MRIWPSCLIGIFLLFTVSCMKVGPNYQRPTVEIPATYMSSLDKTPATSTPQGSMQHFNIHKDIPHQWWQLFHSESLNQLIELGFQHNPSVAAAKASLVAAVEAVRAQKGALLPSLSAEFSPSTQQIARILTPVLADNRLSYALYTSEINVNYTLDFFGGIRREVESLIAQANYQRLQLEATYITLSTNIVNAAIMEASLREQIAATNKIITSQRTILEMYQQRLHMGDASIADISLQEASLAASEATLPPLEKQLALVRNQLNALTGRLPDDARTPSFKLSELHLPTDIPLTLPATLLEHRPDIRAAEEQMHAANALIGVAIANRLPNIALGHMPQGATASDFSKLFTNTSWFWSAIGIVSYPIFDAGSLMFRHRHAKATYEASAALYRLTVINAFQNVSDTLKTLKTDGATLLAANKAKQAALKSFKISKHQQALGDNSILTLLLNEQIYLQTKLNFIQARANRLQNTVALFQALGGGWWNKASDG